MTQPELFALMDRFSAGGLTRLEYEAGGARVVLEKAASVQGASAPAAAPAPAVPAAPAAPHTIRIGALELDTASFILRKNGKTVPLTSTELKILAQLMQSPGRVFTKAQLYECVGGAYYESDDNTMMVHISNLRAKIEDDPAHPQYIRTVRGLGYKIERP